LALGLNALSKTDRTLRWLAYELVLNHRETARSLDIAAIEALAAGLNSWDGVDTFGLYISGPAWRERQINDADIKRWAQSDDLWLRRAALVSTVALNLKARGGTAQGDAKRTLAIAAMLVDDREDMVVKALSWAIRALAVVNPVAARGFLKEHGQRLAARVRREVRNKLVTGLKTPKRGAAK
jgi:3-methyladenine DNA glycosylase AlkD